jgi:hypothetical protein
LSETNSSFPLSISPNRRYLVDRGGKPFLIQGDTAWSIITALTPDEVEQYLSNRAAKGFNAIIVNLVEHFFNGPLTRSGVHPFTNPQDLSTMNDRYFEYADFIIQRAADLGMLVFLAPLYLGYRSSRNEEGWFHEARLSGSNKCWRYGHYLGKRYQGYKNIVWMIGGDRNPDGVVDEVNSLLYGIKEGNPQAMFTAHPHPDEVTVDRYGGSNWGGWLDMSTTYTYQIVHQKLLSDYHRWPTLPFVLIESSYEGEHNSSAVQIRRQAYWAPLSGACGQFLGNNPIWLFNPGWQAAMDLEGSRSMVHWRTFFGSRRWFDLVPDERVMEGWVTANHTHCILGGVGEFRGLDTLTAARTPDGATLMAYMPTPREVTVDMQKIAGSQACAWWFNPRTGQSTPAGTYPTQGPQSFTPPGEGDWGLVIDNAEEKLPPPGE